MFKPKNHHFRFFIGDMLDHFPSIALLNSLVLSSWAWNSTSVCTLLYVQVTAAVEYFLFHNMTHFSQRTHLVSIDLPSGVPPTVFNQKERTAIILEKIFCVFWLSVVHTTAFFFAWLLAFLRVHQL